MPLAATWIGVIINLCGNVVINIAHNSVKYGQSQRQHGGAILAHVVTLYGRQYGLECLSRGAAVAHQCGTVRCSIPQPTTGGGSLQSSDRASTPPSSPMQTSWTAYRTHPRLSVLIGTRMHCKRLTSVMRVEGPAC